MNPTARRTALITLITLALGLTYTGGRLLLAGTYQHQTELFLSDWQQKKQQPAPQAWAVAEQAAQKAVAFYPVANGQYQDSLGRIYRYQHRNEPRGSIKAKASRAMAIDAYRQAIAARPQWPYSYLQLSYMKLKQGEQDDEFKQAMVTGYHLGPWRSIVYRQTAYQGLTSWKKLNEQERKTVKNAINHGLTHTGSSQRYMQRLLTRLQRQDLIAGNRD